MIQLWLLNGEEALPLTLKDMPSLDAVTRALPAGFYTTFRTFRERRYALGLRMHLDRLYRPAGRMGITASISKSALRQHLAALLRVYPAKETRVRLILTTEGDPGSVFAALEPLRLPSADIYKKGVDVVTTGAHRNNPALKSTAFIEESQAERRRLAHSPAYEGLITQNDRILEGITSNFFYVLNGRLGTARRGVLNGVTRREVLRLAVGEGIPLTFRACKLSQVRSLDEAFLTSSSRGIVPIVTIDHIKIADGRVGEWTRRLMKAYESDVEKRIEPIWLKTIKKPP